MINRGRELIHRGLRVMELLRLTELRMVTEKRQQNLLQVDQVLTVLQLHREVIQQELLVMIRKNQRKESL